MTRLNHPLTAHPTGMQTNWHQPSTETVKTTTQRGWINTSPRIQDKPRGHAHEVETVTAPLVLDNHDSDGEAA